MEHLNYTTLEQIGYKGFILKNAPEKVMQFGEGNFLRAFVDYWFDIANEKAQWNGKCLLVQPIERGLADTINDQEGLYTLYLCGLENGERTENKRIISSVSRCLNPYKKDDYDAVMQAAVSKDLTLIVSNTTEAGIVHDPSCSFDDCPPSSFPAKLTQVLYCRYKKGLPGLLILACELIDDNGRKLKNCVEQYIRQWGLEEGFEDYVTNECTFCGSLVDRIVPGRINDPKHIECLQNENGYEDKLMDVGENFGLWVIEGKERLSEVLPFEKAGLGDKVFVTDDISPYKKRKVRILNGAHTGFALGAYLAGKNIVRECMEDNTIRSFMNRMIYEEIIQTLGDDCGDVKSFAASVQDRFANPFIDHELLSISLNSTSKWKTRNMPSFIDYLRINKQIPVCLTASLAMYIAFYSNNILKLNENGLVCRRPDGCEYTVQDEQNILEFYYKHRNSTEEELTHYILANTSFWDTDLSDIVGLEKTVSRLLVKIRNEGAEEVFRLCSEVKNESFAD